MSSLENPAVPDANSSPVFEAGTHHVYHQITSFSFATGRNYHQRRSLHSTMRVFLFLLAVCFVNCFTVAPQSRPTFQVLKLHPDQAKELEQCALGHFQGIAVEQLVKERFQDKPRDNRGALAWCQRILKINSVKVQNKN